LKTDTSLSTSIPAVGSVQFGDFLRLQPISRSWGYDRGQPIDRLYIETFLQQHASDIRGKVLEAGDSAYTLRFGGERTTARDVLHVDAKAPGATVIADLSDADRIQSDVQRGVIPGQGGCPILQNTPCIHVSPGMRSATGDN